MAHFQGRRAPNVSQYIANLNTIPSATEMFQQDQDLSNFDDELALFKDTNFFDFDLGAPGNDLSFDNVHQHQQQQAPSPTNGMVSQPGFFQTFSQYPAPPPSSVGHHSLPPSPPNGVPFAGQIQQSQPTIPTAAHFAAALSPQQGPNVQQGQKRKAGSAGTTGTIPSAVELEESSRMVAEEDKRRRNTAASARFRVKKKQREQALEKTAKEMSERVQVLEARIGQLEMENQWLKGLITEKNVSIDKMPTADGKDGETSEKTVKDVEADKHDDADKEDEERSRDQKKRGVGTVVEAAKA